MGVLIAAAALCGTRLRWNAAAILAVAMGAANATFVRDGEVSVGVTYMTGTIVKFGQRIAAALLGGPPWDWLPYLILWTAFVAGAVAGSESYLSHGGVALSFAAVGSFLLAASAAVLARGPA